MIRSLFRSLAAAALLSLALPSAAEITLEWDDMIPEGWPPPELFEGINIDELQDDDPEAIEFFAKIEQLWDEAPVVESLDGKRVRLPGYAIPLEGDSHSVTSFLLVPYFGACIHVPPPPRNQTVLVNMAEGKTARIRHAFFTVWVTGTMSVETSETDLALTGYTITADEVVPYEPEDGN